MTTNKTTWLLAGLLWLALGAGCTTPQGGLWQDAVDAADEAYTQGNYAEAEKNFRKAVNRAEAFEPEDLRLAQSLNGLAETFLAQGRYTEAEPLHKRALAIREKALGPEHPDVAQSLNNLAVLYKAQGRYTEAEPLYRRSLAIREKALGPEHPDVALSLNNLAGLYHAQGKYAEAEPLYRRALVIKEEALGPERPRASTTWRRSTTPRANTRRPSRSTGAL